jgi:hypothetical protein
MSLENKNGNPNLLPVFRSLCAEEKHWPYSLKKGKISFSLNLNFLVAQNFILAL